MSLDISKIILLKKLYPHNFIFKSVKINECHNLDENDSMIGSIILYSGSDIPNKWLICDGSNLFIDEFSKLYNIIGTTYGGDGVNTFQIPNLKGRVPIGIDDKYSLGNYGGSETHTLNIDELPNHAMTGKTNLSGLHNHSGSTSTIGDHIHNSNSINDQFNEYGIMHKSYGGNNTSKGLTLGENIGNPDLVTSPLKLDIYAAGSHSHNINNDGEHQHTFTTDSIGSNKSHNIMQPYLVMNYLIKYK